MTLDTDIIKEVGLKLKNLARQQIEKRKPVEQRWIERLRQFRGEYDGDTLATIKATPGSSQAFINITRSKTLAAESRLSEMLFPSDDKNWAIQPTPIPELKKTLIEQQQETKLAQEKANKMQAEIDDQLTECNYTQTGRECIHNACLLGTGVIKSPVISAKEITIWEKLTTGIYEPKHNQELKPTAQNISLFGFFPDMSATCIDDCEFVLERHYVNKSQLEKLKKQPGYQAQQIKDFLTANPKGYQGIDDSYLTQLQEMSEIQINNQENRYEIWQFTGILSGKELSGCYCDLDFDNAAEELNVIIEFINDTVIKATLNPLKTLPYHLFYYEKDDTSIFGLGIPDLIKDEQRILNGAMRRILDNASLSTKPKFILNPQAVKSADGSFSILSNDLWFLEDGYNLNDVFKSIDIPSRQAELVNIFQLVKQIIDDVTNLPILAQGELGNTPDTATGMSMLMNNANVVLRKIVKQFDDGITKPMIKGFYHWNMLYNPKEEIKGDYQIDARGSSALLVKETQNQALLSLVSVSQQPIFTDLTKHADLYRKLVQSMHISADEIIKTNEEIANAGQKIDPSQQLMIEKLRAEISKLKSETTVKNVEGMFSAISAAEKAVVLPTLAPIADEIYKSAGGQDFNGFPIIPPQLSLQKEVKDGQIQTPTETEMLNGSSLITTNNQNTHPQYPANPELGMLQGIDS